MHLCSFPTHPGRHAELHCRIRQSLGKEGGGAKDLGQGDQQGLGGSLSMAFAPQSNSQTRG